MKSRQRANSGAEVGTGRPHPTHGRGLRRRVLWRISIATAQEAEEAVAELLAATFGEPASTYTDLETGTTTVSAWFGEKPVWSRETRELIQSGMRRIASCGLKTHPGKMRLAKVRAEDWAESWKRHFKPLEIGAALLVCPSWSRRRARKGQAVVVLDPGLSFGTGQHPTTHFCLGQLARWRKPAMGQSLLDIGTGSGILAIAGAKLGYSPVEALDFDPQAVRVARANARQNGVAMRIALSQQDITKRARRPKHRHTVVCANLLSSLLLAERERIVGCLAQDGLLVLAGILKTEFDAVQRAYESVGLRLHAARTEKEWRSGSFVWRSQALMRREDSRIARCALRTAR